MTVEQECGIVQKDDCGPVKLGVFSTEYKSVKGDKMRETKVSHFVSKQSEETQELADAELVKRAINKDRDAYKILVERYQGRAFALAYRILQSREDAEDVVQESFVKAYLSLSSFKGQSSFYTWLYRIVRNMTIDVKRKTSRQSKREVDVGDVSFERIQESETLFVKQESGPEEDLMRKEQRKRIVDALSGISEEHRSVIILREVDGLDYQQIADVTGVSKGTIMSRLHYARKKLQGALKDFMSSRNSEIDEIEKEAVQGDISEEDSLMRKII